MLWHFNITTEIIANTMFLVISKKKNLSMLNEKRLNVGGRKYDSLRSHIVIIECVCLVVNYLKYFIHYI